MVARNRTAVEDDIQPLKLCKLLLCCNHFVAIAFYW